MPKIKNIFTKARMNKDLDERLVPGGEYREAQNVSIATSEDSDVGAIENIRGNIKVSSQATADGDGNTLYTIGSYVDVSNDRIFWFITSFTSDSPNADINQMDKASHGNICRILMKEGGASEVILAEGLYLNFSTTHHITGINAIGNYLYFTDNYNQPRFIDVDLAKSDTAYYTTYGAEEKVSVAKVAPYLAPMLNRPNTIDIAFGSLVGGTGYSVANDLATTGGTGTGLKVNITTVNSGVVTAVTISDDDIGYGYSVGDVITITGGGGNATITLTVYPNTADGQTLITSDPTSAIGVKSDYMQERFIRFAYRYKYMDGTYSIISPFTQNVFKPLNAGVLKFSPGTAQNVTTNEPKVNISSQSVVETGIVPIMQNAYDKVIMRIPLPTISSNFVISEHITVENQVTTAYPNDKGLRIKDVEILLKESNGLAVKLVDTINIASALQESSTPFSTYSVTPKSGTTRYRQAIEYTYKAKEPFKVLPEKQLIRVADDVPVRAKAQEVVSNRIVYGNITNGYDIPNDEAGNKGISFFLSSDNKGNVEKGVTSGHLYYNTQAFRFHTVKQRRTYQAGVVLLDKYGRMSPVIPSTYKTDDLSDTHTVVAEVTDYSGNTAGSWENTFKTYGKALNIDFQDSRIVDSNKTHTNSSPIGWHAWKVVIKQTEQDYYNVYTQHPMNNWSVTAGKTVTQNPNNHADDQDQVIAGQFNQTSKSRSWFSLTGDNINKVPRSVKDIDEFRDGTAGSEVQLYPKVVQINTSNASNHFDSKMGVDGQEYIDIISIGDAKSQGLFSISNAKNGPFTDGSFIPRSLPDRERVYDFLHDAEKNPLVAEIPNLDNEITNVIGEFTQASDLIVTADDATNDRPFGYPKAKDKGLTVFETKPFQSNLDIYYETATCGNVLDLNDQCEAAASGPTNIKITNTIEKETYSAALVATFPEGFDYTNNNLLQKQIGELTATVHDPSNEGYTMSNFQIMAVTNNDGTDGTDVGKFDIDQEDDVTVVRHSAKQTSAANANAVDLTLSNPGVIKARFKHTELLALSSVGTAITSPISEATTITSISNTGAGFYKVWFYDNSGTNITDQRQCVVQVDSSHNIVAITNEQAGASGNIDPRFMLKVSHQFAFNNDSSDVFDIKIRATQSNNSTALQDITVSVTNSNPIGTNANGFVDNHSTYGTGGKGYQVGTITAVNGSANSALNQTGMTAALSGTNSSMFDINPALTDGSFTVRTNSTFSFSGFFGNDNISGKALNVVFTDNGGATSPSGVGATTFTVFPRVSTAIDGHYLAGATNNVCTIKYSQAATTYYIKSSTGGGGGAAPTQSGGVNAGNIIHTDKLLNNPVAAGTFTVSGIQPRHAVSATGVVSASTYNCPIA